MKSMMLIIGKLPPNIITKPSSSHDDDDNDDDDDDNDDDDDEGRVPMDVNRLIIIILISSLLG